MKIVTTLDALRKLPPHVFTVGMFDGVHLGHQTLFAKLREMQKPISIVTFSTHPLQILQPQKALSLITPLPIKLALLQAQGFESAIVLPFSHTLADLLFDQFLDPLPLSHLILGKGAAFGKGKEGNEANVLSWAEKRGVIAEYIEKAKAGRESISSRRIRDAIKMGDLTLAEQLLGRPHLLSVPADSAYFPIFNLCMPPDGRYPLSQGVQARLITSAEGRFVELSEVFTQPTILSFNPTSNISLRGIHVI